MNVSIIQRKISGGRVSLYLDYSLGGSRRVKVSLGMAVPERPRSATERDEKAQVMQIAEARRSAAYIDLLKGVLPTKRDVDRTVGDYAVELMERRKKPKTRGNWEQLIRYIISAGIDRTPLPRITVRDAVAFRLHLESSSLASSSASVFFGHFRSLLRSASQEGYMPEDITGKIGTIKAVHAQIVFLEQHELNRLLATPIKNKSVRSAFALSCLTGLRWSDIVTLKWDQVHDTPSGLEIRVRQSKTSKLLSIPLHADTIRWMGSRRPDGLVFPQMLQSAQANNVIKRWASAAGITKRVHFHVGRHTYATLALASGIDLKTVSRMLGHSTIRSTEIYAEVLGSTLRHAAGAVKTDAHPDAPDLRIVKGV